MAGLNKVMVIGNLGADPEVRYLSNGAVVANFNLATSESYNNRNGERVTQTEWHRIELWDSLAKIAEQYLKKGRSVFVEGKLRTDTWQDQEGKSRSTTKIRATNMVLLGGRNEASTTITPSQDVNSNFTNTPPVPPTQEQDINADLSSEEPDDLPF